VYAVELYAIKMALEWIEENKIKKALIGSDSVSALYSLMVGISNSHQDLLYSILIIYTRIREKGCEIQLIWIPAHIGIAGNERVDKLAKQAVKRENIEENIKLSKSEGKSIIWKEAIGEWQHQWDMEIKGRHLYAIQSKVGAVKNKGGNRKEEIVMTRLRIGHSNLNGTLHIIGKHPTGFCGCGQVTETIEHVFLRCRQYEEQRKSMMEELGIVGTIGIGMKEILENGENEQRRRSIFLKKYFFIFIKNRYDEKNMM